MDEVNLRLSNLSGRDRPRSPFSWKLQSAADNNQLSIFGPCTCSNRHLTTAKNISIALKRVINAYPRFSKSAFQDAQPYSVRRCRFITIKYSRGTIKEQLTCSK